VSEPLSDPGDRTTLTAVLADLADEGWSGNVTVTEDARFRCPGCRTECDPSAMTVDRLRRMEGTSDPDDMLAVLAVTCCGCGAKGAAVVHYGPTASPEEAEVLMALEDTPARGQPAGES
jgi:hypothetical protein